MASKKLPLLKLRNFISIALQGAHFSRKNNLNFERGKTNKKLSGKKNQKNILKIVS